MNDTSHSMTYTTHAQCSEDLKTRNLVENVFRLCDRQRTGLVVSLFAMFSLLNPWQSENVTQLQIK